MEYKTEILDIVNNPAYTYYKLYVNDKCYFDKFYDEVLKNIADSDDMASIVSVMDRLNAKEMLPKSLFNHIKDAKMHDLYEFKKNRLRVYVIKQDPNIYVVMGGYKPNQKQDIANFKKRVKDFFKKER